MDIGSRIRELRKTKKLTAAELAAAVNTTQQTISNYELNKSEPNIEMLKSICDVLGESLTGFFRHDIGATAVYQSKQHALTREREERLVVEEEVKLPDGEDKPLAFKEGKRLAFILSQRQNLHLTPEQEKAADLLEKMPIEEQLRRIAKAEELLSKIESLPTETRKAIEALINSLPNS